MTDDAAYEVADLGQVQPNIDGSLFKFTFAMKDGPPLHLAIPSHCLFQLSAMTLVAGNQAAAIGGTLTNQQILQVEAVEVHSADNQFDLHFRLSGTRTDLPVSLDRHMAQALVERLAQSLAQGSAAPTGRRRQWRRSRFDGPRPSSQLDHHVEVGARLDVVMRLPAGVVGN